MPAIETQIDIEAPANKVWGFLTDFAAMPTWNPFIRQISGSPTPGARLNVQIGAPGQAAMTFKPTVLAASPDSELRWLGTLMGRWMFAGEHYFLLEPISPRTTRFTHGERFSGLLAPLLMRGRTLEATQQGFIAMNEALKQRAEGG
ncbi:MAG: SRPBCC domain-containing protein [Hyphomicrobium sp.]|uniref:SRPBCC domain-containing protein n=1 Tax=Hyphomicrobium sp. TaxID=82 RepID=UPI0013216BB9|nr:SRPBCC domain-containing protein [Hyphomicrobium sp.]KAB2940904.1 MAG: SRPBCC domain-containing protein [Hyphomicrobium sp.]MBZ0211376.1 SRPBCC domain-containing protein [Hyphomicrobium sp.]